MQQQRAGKIPALCCCDKRHVPGLRPVPRRGDAVPPWPLPRALPLEPARDFRPWTLLFRKAAVPLFGSGVAKGRSFRAKRRRTYVGDFCLESLCFRTTWRSHVVRYGGCRGFNPLPEGSGEAAPPRCLFQPHLSLAVPSREAVPVKSRCRTAGPFSVPGA